MRPADWAGRNEFAAVPLMALGWVMIDTVRAVSPAGQDAATVTRLRLGVGVIAGALPFVVLFGNMLFAHSAIWLGSISGSYYTQMRGVFVGSLCAIGVFLIAYRYDKWDDIWSTVAGGLAIVVALFPTPPDPANGVVTRTQVIDRRRTLRRRHVAVPRARVLLPIPVHPLDRRHGPDTAESKPATRSTAALVA